MVVGPDNGIIHSIEITKDLFAIRFYSIKFYAKWKTQRPFNFMETLGAALSIVPRENEVNLTRGTYILPLKQNDADSQKEKVELLFYFYSHSPSLRRA